MVDVSLDGGASYESAVLEANGDWSYDWTVPWGIDHALLPLRVRVTDVAGNMATLTQGVLADNQGPTWRGRTSLPEGNGSWSGDRR